MKMTRFAEEPDESSHHGHASPLRKPQSQCSGFEQQLTQDTDASTVSTLDHVSNCDSWRSECEPTSSWGSASFSWTPVADVWCQLQACQREASEGVMDWRAAGLRFVKAIQPAQRNQGRVDEMQHIHGGRFAVKMMPTSWVCRSHEEFRCVHPEESEQPWHDIAVVRYLHSKGFTYTCYHYGIFRDELNTYVVSELADGDAFSWCTESRGPAPGPQREAAVAAVFRQMAVAVAWLHDLGIAHRDVSLENTLLVTDPVTGALCVKIIDFGMATFLRYDNQVVGKPSYQAPEMHSEAGEIYDGFRADVFSLGVALYSLAVKDYPWNSTRPGCCRRFEAHCALGFRGYIALRKVPRTQATVIEIMSEPLVDLLESLLEPCPMKRITLGERCWELSSEERLLQVSDMPWMGI